MRVRNWRLHAVSKRAASLGCRIRLVRKLFGPRHLQNRMFINGRRCQLTGGLRDWVTNAEGRMAIDLRAHENFWPEFVICVPGPEDEGPIYIIPSSRLHAPTLHTAEQLENYADAWRLLK